MADNSRLDSHRAYCGTASMKEQRPHGADGDNTTGLSMKDRYPEDGLCANNKVGIHLWDKCANDIQNKEWHYLSLPPVLYSSASSIDDSRKGFD